jgi:copper chaperone
VSDVKQVILNVPGISCNHCRTAIEGAVRGLAGIGSVEVTIAEKTVTVRFDEEAVTVAAIRRAVEDEGYAVVGEHEFLS